MTHFDGLRVVALTKSYSNGVRALDGISLEVGPGLYGLLGPNGAGKSTLMRTLATLQSPDSGTFTLDGIDALAEPDRLRQRLGYLPQQLGAYPGVSAWELLERVAWLKGRTDRATRRHEVGEILERVNLRGAARRSVATYSGGMLRRFGVAMALLGSPRLLVVDEPTAGLDPAERDRFHSILAEVAADSVVLLSTHIVEDVENLCRRLAILEGGRIVAEGASADLAAPLAGHLFERIIPRGEPLPKNALYTSARPDGTRVVVKSDVSPGPDYRPRVPHLDDVYHDALSRRADESSDDVTPVIGLTAGNKRITRRAER